MHKEMLERFIFNILMRMEDEVRLLLNILTQFNDANQNLKNYLDNLENARSKISLKDEATQELINGTPHRPRLNMLLIWAVESFQFYHKMYYLLFLCSDLLIIYMYRVSHIRRKTVCPQVYLVKLN
ncbi:hypothetical protein X777_13025 [Ooceraea biroi]|uniref:Uncharacterized protein n=1 Tax=Ooceraea biroi TaxID=2015173 RepID=A0A026X099_OOCBI|nr:hypothetical protein X777_13025 [Ooceraea biroi]